MPFFWGGGYHLLAMGVPFFSCFFLETFSFYWGYDFQIYFINEVKMIVCGVFQGYIETKNHQILLSVHYYCRQFQCIILVLWLKLSSKTPLWWSLKISIHAPSAFSSKLFLNEV
jgi:hypothetical protein